MRSQSSWHVACRRGIASWKGLDFIIPCKTRDSMAFTVLAANIRRDYGWRVWPRHWMCMSIIEAWTRYGCIWRRR